MRILIVFLFVIVLYSCKSDVKQNQEARKKSFDQFSEAKRDSIAENYNAWANYFLQPSKAYRIYKDSANMAQPNNVAYLQTKSYSYKKRGEHITAMKLLNNVVDKDLATKSVDALQYRAWTLLYYYRDYEGALKDIDLIEEITANQYSQCWGEPCSFQKGQALYKLEKYEAAISVFNELIEEELKRFKEVSNHMYYLYLGRSYFKNGDSERAIQSYKTAIELYPNFLEGHFYLAEVYETAGQKDKARAIFQKCATLTAYQMNEPYVERFDEVFPYMIKKITE